MSKLERTPRITSQNKDQTQKLLKMMHRKTVKILPFKILFIDTYNINKVSTKFTIC